MTQPCTVAKGCQGAYMEPCHYHPFTGICKPQEWLHLDCRITHVNSFNGYKYLKSKILASITFFSPLTILTPTAPRGGGEIHPTLS